MLGRFDFELISKSILHSLDTTKTKKQKKQISIAVRYQDICSMAGRRVSHAVYVKMIDNFYAIAHARRRWDGT